MTRGARGARLATTLVVVLSGCAGTSQADAGPEAGARPDAGVFDAGADGGRSDAGPVDGGPADAGPSDAGDPDAGDPDAGASDGGRIAWPRFAFDPARSGVNPAERALSPETVGRLTRVWRAELPGTADGAPAFLPDVAVDGTPRDLLFLTTREGHVLAVDAADGTILWTRQPQGPNVLNASPVVDPDGPTVYAYGLDGDLHAFRADTGEELQTGPFPVTITKMPGTEKGSSNLNLAEGRIFVTTAGYVGDAPPYQGHVVMVAPASGEVSVFNALCSDVDHVLAPGECDAQRAGIWGRGGAVWDAETGRLFVTTGNGPYDADQGGHDWGDTVLALSPDLSRVLDSYTPENHAALSAADQDLGSTSPALLPRLPGSRTPLLAVQGGKDGRLRLLDRTDLSGQGGPGHLGGALQDLESAACATFTQPVVWTAPDGTVLVLVAGTCGVAAYRAESDASGAPRLVAQWKGPVTGTTPVIAGGVLFIATDGALRAFDPETGDALWSSAAPEAGGTLGPIHWESPIAVDGRVFVSDQDGALSAYGLR